MFIIIFEKLKKFIANDKADELQVKLNSSKKNIKKLKKSNSKRNNKIKNDKLLDGVDKERN
ncbi:hypothetical protein HOK68_04690, partial [Candidatus Woesearchaeota archaeon]|nr:hypothetical protein [Candidatus Woesearchaeota archaeon]